MANEKITFQELVLECIQLGLNKEQNAQVPPDIFSVATRLSTDWLLDEIVRVYPFNTRISDKCRPFLKRKLVSVNDGIATFPDDYRNILEIRISVNKDATAGCNCGEVEECEKIEDHCTPVEKAPIRKEKCYFVPVTILDADQYAEATQSDLYPPTLKQPIGTFTNRTEFKICPIDGITYIELVYIKQPLFYNNSFIVFSCLLYY